MSGAAGSFDAGERVLVIGLGRSGRAVVRVLRARGCIVHATDEAPPERLGEAIAEIERTGARFVAPGEAAGIAPAPTAAVLSPGVPLNGAFVRAVQAARIPVYSEIEVAYRIGRAPIVAITGTKGKSTTTALVGALLAGSGRTTHVGGNIGNPLVGETVKAMPADWVVAEVSSFQLESIRSFKPRIATILNVSPDHLDRYHSMDEYTEAKFRIFANQGPGDTFVGNLDDPIVATLAAGIPAERIAARALWFSRTEHRRATLSVRGGRIRYAPPTGDPRPVDVLPTDEIPLFGEHNLENVLAAVLIALAAGCDQDAIRAAVRTFAPLAHRLQRVLERDGVLYVDDSKATNPGSVVAALRAFARPVVLIAGGKAKGTDFAALGAEIDARTRAVVLIGEAADDLSRVIDPARVRRAETMEAAVASAAAVAEPGDVVLLSPGCASFDMFDSAEHRGETFARAARGEAPGRIAR